MLANPWPHTSKSSMHVPTIQLDILETIKKAGMTKEENKDKKKDDQNFEAMNKEVNIIEVQMNPGRASSSVGAKVHLEKDRVWVEFFFGGIGGRRMPMAGGGISGMDEKCCMVVLGPEQEPESSLCA